MKLRLADVKARLGDPRAMHAFRQWVAREEDAGRFPKRIRMSERLHVWDADEVDAWVASRPRGRAHGTPKDEPEAAAGRADELQTTGGHSR